MQVAFSGYLRTSRFRAIEMSTDKTIEELCNDFSCDTKVASMGAVQDFLCVRTKIAGSGWFLGFRHSEINKWMRGSGER